MSPRLLPDPNGLWAVRAGNTLVREKYLVKKIVQFGRIFSNGKYNEVTINETLSNTT
jgi:hypothetical protein